MCKGPSAPGRLHTEPDSLCNLYLRADFFFVVFFFSTSIKDLQDLHSGSQRMAGCEDFTRYLSIYNIALAAILIIHLHKMCQISILKILTF